MKKTILLAVILFACFASAQTIPLITSTPCIKDGSGTAMTSGKIVFQGVNDNSYPIPFSVGGTQYTTTPFSVTVTSGSVGSLNIPDPASSNPSNIKYHVVILDSTNKVVANYTKVQVYVNDGSTHFDWCLLNTGLFVLGPTTTAFVTGPVGPGVPTGGATGTFLYKTSSSNYATAWDADLIYDSSLHIHKFAGPIFGTTSTNAFNLQWNGSTTSSRISFCLSVGCSTEYIQLNLTSIPINLLLPVSFGSTIKSYNGVATVSNGVPSFPARVDLAAQTADIGATTFYTVPASGAGMYRAWCYLVVTTADPVSGELPKCLLTFTDNDTNVTSTMTLSPATVGNPLAVGFNSSAASSGPRSVLVLNAKASTNIQYSTNGYASNTPATQQFSLHLVLEAIGN